MSRRTERVGNLIRNTLGQILLAKTSDPRIDPARTSITHVEVSDDFMVAKVFVSVLGTEAEQRRTLRALGHAAGHFQDLMMREISLRSTPALNFVIDVNFKKTLQTLEIIQHAMEEIRQKDELAGETEDTDQAQGQQDDAPDEPQADDQ